jgi:hypothetical protein
MFHLRQAQSSTRPQIDTLFTVQNQRTEDENGSIMMELGVNHGSKIERARRARRAGLARRGGFVWFIWFVWSIWFVSFVWLG